MTTASKTSPRASRPALAAAALLLTASSVALAAPRQGNYLIITAQDYESSAPLNQFTSAKTAQGFDVTTFTPAPGTDRTGDR